MSPIGAKSLLWWKLQRWGQKDTSCLEVLWQGNKIQQLVISRWEKCEEMPTSHSLMLLETVSAGLDAQTGASSENSLECGFQCWLTNLAKMANTLRKHHPQQVPCCHSSSSSLCLSTPECSFLCLKLIKRSAGRRVTLSTSYLLRIFHHYIVHKGHFR